MTAHSNTVLSELKMSPPPLARTQARRLTFHQLRYQLHSVEGVPNVQQFLNFVDSWFVHELLDKAVNKQAQ